MLAVWARVLRAVDGSRLIMLSPEGPHRGDILRRLEQQGVAPGQVAFVAHQPPGLYLKVYHGIDLVLDTFPYNGHTTSLDAFWMGVPVVTTVGRTVVGRAGVSHLRNLRLPEMAAQTPEEFVRIAVGLAGDLPRLSGLRATLRERMRRSPLMDAPGFARGIEAAYRTMWRRWCDTVPLRARDRGTHTPEARIGNDPGKHPAVDRGQGPALQRVMGLISAWTSRCPGLQGR